MPGVEPRRENACSEPLNAEDRRITAKSSTHADLTQRPPQGAKSIETRLNLTSSIRAAKIEVPARKVIQVTWTQTDVPATSKDADRTLRSTHLLDYGQWPTSTSSSRDGISRHQTFGLRLQDNCAHAGQAACSCSLRVPPRRCILRMSRPETRPRRVGRRRQRPYRPSDRNALMSPMLHVEGLEPAGRLERMPPLPTRARSSSPQPQVRAHCSITVPPQDRTQVSSCGGRHRPGPCVTTGDAATGRGAARARPGQMTSSKPQRLPGRSRRRPRHVQAASTGQRLDPAAARRSAAHGTGWAFTSTS